MNYVLGAAIVLVATVFFMWWDRRLTREHQHFDEGRDIANALVEIAAEAGAL